MREKSNKKMMILSFIGIILVVLGHTKNGISLFSDIFPYYSFHMTLFIFISWYFYKEINECKLKDYILSKIKKLLIPYFVWNIIYGLILLTFKHFDLVEFGDRFNLYSLFVRPWVDGHQFHLNIAAWFILSLFIVNVLYILFRILMKKLKIWNDYIFLIIFLIVSIISIKYSKDSINYMLPLLRTGFFIFFYQFGVVYKKLEGKLKINNIIKLLIIIIIQLITIKLDSSLSYLVVFMDFGSKYLFTPIVASITGILFWTIISEMLTPSLKDNKIVNYISSHTKEIMFHHIFWIVIINTVIKLISNPLKLSGFNNELFRTTVYYCYTPGVKQFTILYAILCITIPLIIHYVYEKYFIKLLNKTKQKKAN